MKPSFAWVASFGKDVRFSLRQFRRAPAYAGFTTLVLALGIGTVTAMFTISYGVLLKPLPFRADRELFEALEKTSKDEDGFATNYQEVSQWQEATRGSADVAFAWGGLNIMDAPAGAEMISEVSSSPNLLATLGVAPMMGRTFNAAEQISDQPSVAILSYEVWQRSFGGASHVLGTTVHIGGVLYTVIGVMPPNFEYPVYEKRAEVWVPLERSTLAKSSSDPYAAIFEPVIRLRRGVKPAAVEAEIQNVHARSAKAGERSEIHLVREHDLLVRDVQPALFALEIAVGIVWLIACSNVAGLLLARVAARRSEIAVRSALGANRRRIVAQFLTESLLLSVAGAAGGLGMAAAVLRVFRRTLANMVPLSRDIQFNWAVWLALIGLTLVTTVAFGAVPAMLAARRRAIEGLRSSGKKLTGDRGQNRVRAALLIGEVALSIALLIGAGLMLRTMYALRHVPLGFRTDHLILTSLTAPSGPYQNTNIAEAAWSPLLERVRSIPGVQEAAMSTVMPIGHPLEWLTIVYKTDWTAGDGNAAVRAASPGLMSVLGIQMRSGRFFNASDTNATPPVTVVNRAFVNRYLGGADALGKQIRFGRIPRTATIIGVIDDVHQDAVTAESMPEFYLSTAQVPQGDPLYRALLSRYMELAVRTEIAPAAMIAELRREIAQANPRLAIGEFTTMQQAVEDSIGGQTLAAEIVGVFGGLALLITAVGLYALLSYLVEQRKQEIGIRMALGADRAVVVAMILRQTLALLGAGVVIGIGIAIWSDRLLQGFLFGVKVSDAWTMALAPLVLVLCGVLAAALPARRAASVNPVEALRAE